MDTSTILSSRRCTRTCHEYWAHSCDNSGKGECETEEGSEGMMEFWNTGSLDFRKSGSRKSESKTENRQRA